MVSTLSSAEWLVETSKWSSRGWTYQEGLLSKRRLIFTDQQIIWECNSMHSTESLALPLYAMHTKNKERYKVTVPHGPFHYKTPGCQPWAVMSYVAPYNNKHLTFPEDQLNAIQGIFRKFSRSAHPLHQFMGVPILPAVAAFKNNTSHHRIARTPTEGFLIGLSWYHSEPGERRPHFPSWSWAGWTG
jgi:hypothetical protein